YTVSFKMSPDAPAQESTGTSENKWVLGGRYVKQKVSGMMDMHGQSMQFEGIGLMGHDNVKGKYNSVWIDNMSTTMMVSDGAYDPATKTIKEDGQFFCALRGGEVSFNSTLQIVDNDHLVYTMYDTTGDQSFKAMEIKYTRKK
ncbi:MAG: DUF1579 domain-containing protein, partial [Alphaproteobacteria bacterium]|nr:DUF1579 domain-containing protein [Alphaproteobacteria bacterium]